MFITVPWTCTSRPCGLANAVAKQMFPKFNKSASDQKPLSELRAVSPKCRKKDRRGGGKAQKVRKLRGRKKISLEEIQSTEEREGK